MISAAVSEVEDYRASTSRCNCAVVGAAAGVASFICAELRDRQRVALLVTDHTRLKVAAQSAAKAVFCCESRIPAPGA